MYEEVINGYKPKGACFQELQNYWDDEATLLASGFAQGELEEVKLVIGVNVGVLGEYVNPLWRDSNFAEAPFVYKVFSTDGTTHDWVVDMDITPQNIFIKRL